MTGLPTSDRGPRGLRAAAARTNRHRAMPNRKLLLEKSRMIRIDDYNLRTDFTLRLLWSELIAVEPYEVPRVRMPLLGEASR